MTIDSDQQGPCAQMHEHPSEALEDSISNGNSNEKLFNSLCNG